MSYQKVIIIGAPRSGTNMLRDVLCRLPGFGTWPCDEINYIWRHGNARWPSDAFPAELATPRVSNYLERAFSRRARAGKIDHLVEKTCANSLRVPFIDRALPDSRYLFLHRHPLDAVPSAMKRWGAALDLRYTLKKARFVPLTDVPYYGWKFLKNRLHRSNSSDRSVASWGPRFNDMGALLGTRSLADICALQWTACVESAAQALGKLPDERVHILSYEGFVGNPEAELKTVVEFLGSEVDGPALEEAVRSVSNRSLGKGRAELSPKTLESIASLVAPGREAVASLVTSKKALSAAMDSGS